MGDTPLLKQAKKAYQNRQYSRVIQLLEPEILKHREDGGFYRLLGAACFQTGDFGGADTYLQRSSQIRDRDPEVLTALAQIHIRRRQTDKALKLLLDALELDPRHGLAQKTLEGLRKHGHDDSLGAWVQSPAFRQLTPGFFPSFRWSPVLPFLFGGLAGLAFVVTFSSWFPLVSGWLFPPPVPTRQGSEGLSLQDVKEFTTFQGEFREVLTTDEIKKIWSEAQSSFNAYRDNLTQKALNRLLNSNASADVKGRAKTLRGLLKTPDFTTFKDNFTYKEVRQAPWSYDGNFVRWKGRVVNKTVTEKEITFDFLIGYETGQVLEGILPVSMDFAALFENGDALDLLAKVVFVDNQLSLKAVALHKLVP